MSQILTGLIVSISKSSASDARFLSLACLRWSQIFHDAVRVESVPNSIVVLFFKISMAAVFPYKNSFDAGHHTNALNEEACFSFIATPCIPIILRLKRFHLGS